MMTTEEMLAQVLSKMDGLETKVDGIQADQKSMREEMTSRMDSIETRMATHEDIVSVRREMALLRSGVGEILYTITESAGGEIESLKKAR